MKLNKKLLLASTIAIGAISGFSAVLASKVENQFKPSFYNYKSYMSDANIAQLAHTFDYKEFDEINQFSNALINNKAVAGIGSEFLAVELAKKQLIGKLNYSIFFNLPQYSNYLEYQTLKHQLDDLKKQLIDNPNNQKLKDAYNDILIKYQDAQKSYIQIKNYVRLSMRPEIWEHLNRYDLSKKGDNNSDESLWEYFYPYYSQDMVVAYNIHKINKEKLNKNAFDEDSGIDFSKYADKFITPNKSSIKDPYALINILKTLKVNGYQDWEITDAIRDNMLYGSAYWPLPDGGRTLDKFTGAVVKDDSSTNTQPYKILIDSFADLIKDGTGFDVRNAKHISLKGDGLEIANDLINKKRPDVTSAIMYNGDAIDAYYSEDNFPDVPDGSIRAVKPHQNILLVDGIVISSHIPKELSNEYQKAISQGYYSYLNDIGSRYDKLVNQKMISTFNENTSDAEIAKAQNLVTEEYVANVWKDLKTLELGKIDSSDIKTSDINTFINSLYNEINLASKQNAEKFNEFYKLRDDYDQGNDVDQEQRISYVPHLLENYLSKNYSEFINKFSQLAQKSQTDLFTISKEEFINKVSKTISDKILATYVYSVVNNDLSDEDTSETIKGLFDDALKETNEKSDSEKQEIWTEFITSFIAKMLANVNISDKEYLAKHLNLENFDYVNYDPVAITDYEVVLRNYFNDKYEGQDFNLINIYEIKNTDGMIHEAIQPVDDKTLSQITTYYFSKVKS
ncbi:hypothetical protein ACXYRP_00205 [Mycoplasma sp. 5912]